MKASFWLFLGISGLMGLEAVSLPVAAGSNDDWLSTSAFRRAQEKNFNDGEIVDSSPFFFERQPRFFDSRKGRRTYERRRRNRFFDFFNNFDPEPDLNIVQGKPKSPDDGFGIYRPAKL